MKTGTLVYKIINSDEELFALSEEWSRLARIQNPDNVFLDFIWISGWWRHFGRGKTLQIVTVHYSGSLIAIVPLCSQLGYRGKIIQFIGRPGSDYSDLVIHPDHQDATSQIWLYVLDQFKEFIIRIEGLPENSPSYAFFSESKSIFGRQVRTNAIYNSPYVPISNNWGDYQNSRRKSLIQDIARKSRRLDRIGEVTFENTTDPGQIKHLISHMIDQKKQRYKSTGAKDIFRDSRYKSFYGEIAQKFFAINSLDLSYLKLEDKIIAVHFGFHYGNRLYWYMPSFSPSHSRYSPSNVLLYNLLKRTFHDGCTEFDFLSGDASFKYEWTDQYRKVYCVFVYPNNVMGKILGALYSYALPKIKTLQITQNIIRIIRKF